jgi:hypothetical protein
MESIFKEYKTPLNSFIGAWFIKTKICDELVQYFKENKNLAKIGTVNDDEVQSYAKDSLDVSLKKENKLLKKYWSESFQKLIFLYEKKYKFVSDLHKYNLVENPNIQYYKPGGGFKVWHCERTGPLTCTRQLVFMTYLNTVDNAGTEFYYQKLKIPCKKGLTLIWPSDFTHTHKGIINEKKEKYILTGWLNYT